MKRKYALLLPACLHFVTLNVFVDAKLEIYAAFFHKPSYLCTRKQGELILSEK